MSAARSGVGVRVGVDIGAVDQTVTATLRTRSNPA